MKHFVVCRRREVREFITVAAEDEEEARERAQETIDRVDEPDWSPDDQWWFVDHDGEDNDPGELEVRESEEVDYVGCKFCHEPAEAKTAHLHQGMWVGDMCCWDERLRSSE